MQKDKKEISVVILTSRGPRHSFFCSELAKHYAVRGILVDERYGFFYRLKAFLKTVGANPLEFMRRLKLKRKLQSYEHRDEEIEKKFFPVSELPSGIPVFSSPEPNGPEAIAWIRRFSPDVVVVFGTRLIKDPVLSLAKFGALNIHTGLSPFYRGGQCTFWCLYQNDLEHVGVTIHHLTQRIDGGDILFTAKPEIHEKDTVRSLECKLVQIGTEKMIQAIQELAQGKSTRMPQLEKGQLFLSKMFTLEKRLELEKRLDQGLMKALLAKSSLVKVGV